MKTPLATIQSANNVLFVETVFGTDVDCRKNDRQKRMTALKIRSSRNNPISLGVSKSFFLCGGGDGDDDPLSLSLECFGVVFSLILAFLATQWLAVEKKRKLLCPPTMGVLARYCFTGGALVCI
jgi:hypothetical protein